MHESSVASNVVNSNSAGSNFSNSQKTPTTLSQQLTLMGSCANCGAHQLAQVPVSAHAHHLPAPVSVHQTKGGPPSSTSGKLANECSARQVSSACSGGGGSHATILKSSLSTTSGQPSSQCRLAGGTNEVLAAPVAANPTTGGARSSASILMASAGGGHKQATAKVLHSKIPSSASGGAQSANEQLRAGLFKRMSSDDHLLADTNRCGRQEPKSAIVNGLSLLASGGAQRRPTMASLSRLNDLNGTTSSHCGHDESISSLANDSFANTSQENTPCMGAHGAHLHSNGAQRYYSGKGSDSMLWNQSVYSIDYCSDCCPSYCHSFCPACSSNGCDGETGSAGGQPMCVHASSGTVLDSMQLQQAADTDPDDFDSALCDQSICTTRQQIDEAGAGSIRRRKSGDPSEKPLGTAFEAPPDPTSHYYDCDEHHHKAAGASASSSQTAGTTMTRIKFRDGNPLKPTSRSQTMEMRTIVVDKSGAGKLKLRQSVDEETLVQAANAGKQLSKQHRLTNTSGASSSLVYALQAAASSAYTVAQMAATANVQPSAELQQGGGGSGGGAKHQFTSTKDKFSEKLGSARQSTSDADVQRTVMAANQQTTADDKQRQQQQGHTGGAIQFGLEMVKSMDSSRRKSTDCRRHNHYHRKSSCLSYHDDYEYSYGLVQSNSNSENYYPEELSGEADTSVGSLVKDETSDEGLPPGKGYDEYYDDIVDNDEEDDFDHDGRLTLSKLSASETSTPKQGQSAGVRHRLSKGNTASVKYRSSAGSSSSSLSRQRPVTSSRELELDDHRINSVTLIAATLSAGGAIVESSGGSSSSQQQSLVDGDKFTSNLSGISNQQQQKQEQKDSKQDEKQADQIGCLTTL